MTSSGRNKPLFDTHPGVVVSLAKSDVCTLSSFGGVTAHVRMYTRTDRISLYALSYAVNIIIMPVTLCCTL